MKRGYATLRCSDLQRYSRILLSVAAIINSNTHANGDTNTTVVILDSALYAEAMECIRSVAREIDPEATSD